MYHFPPVFSKLKIDCTGARFLSLSADNICHRFAASPFRRISRNPRRASAILCQLDALCPFVSILDCVYLFLRYRGPDAAQVFRNHALIEILERVEGLSYASYLSGIPAGPPPLVAVSSFGLGGGGGGYTLMRDRGRFASSLPFAVKV